MSNDHKTTLNMGYLVPTFHMDCVPGDRINITCEALIRLMPLVAPMMHLVHVYFHTFFVPWRILWPNWEKFITNTKVGVALPAVPYFQMSQGNWGANPTMAKLADYFGIPTGDLASAPTVKFTAFVHAAYQRIYEEYYRDQNLITPMDSNELDDGNNTADFARWLPIKKRAWEHDYFTSCLPFAQKGDAVDIPIGSPTDVRVYSNRAAGGTTLTGAPDNQDVAYAATGAAGIPADALYADTSSMTLDATTINDLRRAYRLQEWLEKNARGGTRYIENILVHFGVHSSDKRLQRPEYVTGSKTPIKISEVLQTSSTDDETPQGNMAGHGVAAVNSGYGSYFCEEHGTLMTIMSAMPKTAYQQGLDKHFRKYNDPTEYYWPTFQHLGEQEVVNEEIYAYQGVANEDTFGYNPRYSEYKYMNNRVSGQFKSTLNTWHMGRIFSTPPALNETFISADPTHRVFAVTDEGDDKLLAHIYHKVRALRPMSKYGTPTF